MDCGTVLYQLATVSILAVLEFCGYIMPFKISVLHNKMSLLTVIQCPGLPNILNGAVDTSGGTNYKCTAVYTCNTGYALNGNITRTCQEDGMWSGSEPTCDGEIM